MIRVEKSRLFPFVLPKFSSTNLDNNWGRVNYNHDFPSRIGQELRPGHLFFKINLLFKNKTFHL
jgi:hypothetical protein